MSGPISCCAAVAAVMLGAFASRAAGQGAAKLEVGDVAPALVADRWVRGGPVAGLEKGKVYVLEFWATWCGPCVMAMPHLTRLQKKYADQGVVVIGVNVWERDPARVEPFLREMGDRVGYAVATDVVPEGRMAETWMRAAGLNQIPTSFIVDREGKVAWIGHPRRMERPLRLIAAGKFDAAAEAAAQAGVEEKRLADEAAVFAALRERRHDEALAIIDRLIALDEGSLTTPTTQGAEPYGLLKLKALVLRQEYAAASALAAELEKVLPEDGRSLQPVLDIVAWAPDLKPLDTDLMLRLARRMADEAPKEDWKAPRMLARVHAARGEYDQAIEAQRRAVEGAPQRERPWEEARLKIYLLDQAEAKELARPAST